MVYVYYFNGFGLPPLVYLKILDKFLLVEDGL